MSIVKDQQKIIDKAQDKINRIQAACTHPTEVLEMTHGGDTGNYDPHEDCYWRDYYCGLCGKSWRVYNK